MTWKIITDSGCDIKHLESLPEHCTYINVPLTIHVGEEEFIDNEALEIDQMMVKMYAYEGKTSSSCPSPESYLQSFEGADNIIVVTITGTLSGSHNSAQLAKKMYLEEHPEANIEIIDSLSASGEMVLLTQAIANFIKEDPSFEVVVEKARNYHSKTKLLFALASVDNLVKNGRLSKLVGRVVGLLNIRMVGQASTEGTLELLHKSRGQKRTVTAIWDEMKKNNYQGGRVAISHCDNPEICAMITTAIHAEFPNADVQAYPTSGLCSYYAEQGGILMGYETH